MREDNFEARRCWCNPARWGFDSWRTGLRCRCFGATVGSEAGCSLAESWAFRTEATVAVRPGRSFVEGCWTGGRLVGSGAADRSLRAGLGSHQEAGIHRFVLRSCSQHWGDHSWLGLALCKPVAAAMRLEVDRTGSVELGYSLRSADFDSSRWDSGSGMNRGNLAVLIAAGNLAEYLGIVGVLVLLPVLQIYIKY